MAPNKWLEDAKPKLVRKFDKLIDGVNGLFGKKPTEAQLAEREEVYKKLDGDLATETWGNLLKARFLAEAAVGVAVLVPLFFDPQRKGVVRVGEAGLNLLKKLEPKNKSWDFLRPQPEGSFDPLYPPKANKISGLAFNASIEGAATGIAATYLYFKLKAKELLGKKEPKEQKKQSIDDFPPYIRTEETEVAKVKAPVQTQMDKEVMPRKKHREVVDKREASFAAEKEKQALAVEESAAIQAGV